MKNNKLTVRAIFVLIKLIVLCYPGFSQSIDVENTPCYFRPTAINNQHLLSLLNKYLPKVEADALPILSIVTDGDSSMLYIGATISANAIQKSPPSFITMIGKREVAVYTGGESLISLDESCLSKLVSKYREILQVDKLNTKKGLVAGTVQYYGYDHIWVKIVTYKEKVISVKDKGDLDMSVPYFKFSF